MGGLPRKTEHAWNAPGVPSGERLEVARNTPHAGTLEDSFATRVRGTWGGAEHLSAASRSYTHAPLTNSHSFSKGDPQQSGKPGQTDPSDCGPTSLPRQEGRGRAERCVPRAAHAPLAGSPWSGIQLPDSPPRRECACAVAGFPPPPLPLPLSPRGGSGSGGTMFTSTGSSGLCEYRLPPSWLFPTRHRGHLLEKPGGSGDPRGCRRFGGRPSIPAPEP